MPSRSGFGHRLADWGENFDMTQLLSGVLLVSLAAIAANELMRMARAAMQRVAVNDGSDRDPRRWATPTRAGMVTSRALDDVSLDVAARTLHGAGRPERLR